MIRAFCGKNGHGKSFAMIQRMVIPSWETGRVVVSNIALYPEELGYPTELYRPLESFSDISRLGRYMVRRCETCGHRARGRECRRCGLDGLVVELPRLDAEGKLWSITDNKPCTLLLDEITSVLPARDAVNVPPELQRMLNQFRKPDVWVGWTAPAWARADLMLREVTMDVTICSPFLPLLFSKKVPGSAWPSHRAFVQSRFDAFDYEEADATGQKQFLRGQHKRVWRKAVIKKVQAAYDTQEGVELLDHIQCGDCGGKFSRKVCKCGDSSHRPKPTASAPPAAATGPTGPPRLPSKAA